MLLLLLLYLLLVLLLCPACSLFGVLCRYLVFDVGCLLFVLRCLVFGVCCLSPFVVFCCLFCYVMIWKAHIEMPTSKPTLKCPHCTLSVTPFIQQRVWCFCGPLREKGFSVCGAHCAKLKKKQVGKSDCPLLLCCLLLVVICCCYIFLGIRCDCVVVLCECVCVCCLFLLFKYAYLFIVLLLLLFVVLENDVSCLLCVVVVVYILFFDLLLCVVDWCGMLALFCL